MRSSIIVRTQFEALHNWPQHSGFLQHPHRHLFKVSVELPVRHDDRDLEFFEVKNQIDKLIGVFIIAKKTGVGESIFEVTLPVSSCEAIAEKLWRLLPWEATRIEVSEDGENSGVYYKD